MYSHLTRVCVVCEVSSTNLIVYSPVYSTTKSTESPIVPFDTTGKVGGDEGVQLEGRVILVITQHSLVVAFGGIAEMVR